MIYQTFLSPQVKRYTIISYKHGINILPHDLPNDLRLNPAVRIIDKKSINQRI